MSGVGICSPCQDGDHEHCLKEFVGNFSGHCPMVCFCFDCRAVSLPEETTPE